MPSIELKTKQEVGDFVRGTTFFGTGGGGNPVKGLELLYKDLEEGRKIEFKDVKEIGNEGWSACPFLMGTIAPETKEIKKKKSDFGFSKKVVVNPLIDAIRELESYSNKKADVIVAVELGGGNTPGPLDVAVRTNKILVDGDYSARAIPEIVQTSPHISHKVVTPITAVDEYGDIGIIKEATNNRVAERIGKLFSEGAFGLAGEAGIMLKVSEMKEVVQPGTLSRSYEVGKAIRTARERRRDPVEAAVESSKGNLLFEGKVSKKTWEDRDGYMWGMHIFKGTGSFAQKKFKIWFKNENHISWLDDEKYVTSPDLIEVVRRKDAEPITNTNLAVGDEVAIIGMKANSLFRTAEGLKVLGPRYFGFDYKYVPIEKIVED
ncbi:MAG: DUF917 domain-containing protein [Thermoplasmatales archaeon]|jgi:DUF917 family protein|nr:DUF917 domain-containing protein [Candidatus Thermoplasmatota archaeon]MDA8055381.1 DUF917 domain-containing protein [Thermoplasmatales archaeon]